MIACNGGWKCERCGRWYATHQECCQWLAGDDLEHALNTLGITKERWMAIRERLHLDPKCNCQARQEWLNKTSVELQVQVDKLRKILKTWYSRPR